MKITATLVGVLAFAGCLVAPIQAGPSAPGPDFLDAELHVTPGAGIEPGPSGFSVRQITAAMGEGKKHWKAQVGGQWILGIGKTDPLSGRKQALVVLFALRQGNPKNGVVIARMMGNRQEFPPALIFQFVQQAAIKAEGKK